MNLNEMEKSIVTFLDGEEYNCCAKLGQLDKGSTFSKNTFCAIIIYSPYFDGLVGPVAQLVRARAS